MINNSNWYHKFSIYLDPKLKVKDVSLYQNILSFLNEANFSIESSLDLSNSEFEPLLITTTNPKTEKVNFLQFKEKNMSLFAETFDGDVKPLGVFNSFDEFKNSFKIYKNVIDKFIFELEEKILKKSIKRLKTISSVKHLNENPLSNSLESQLNEFELELYKLIDFERIPSFLELISKKLKIEIVLKYPNSIYNSDLLHFPLFLNKENTDTDKKQLQFLCFHPSCSESFAARIYSSVSIALERMQDRVKQLTDYKDLDQLFSKLDIPLAVFDLDQNLILHNDLFINLNLSAKECFGFSVNEQVTIEGEVYKVQKVQDSNKNIMQLNFIPVNEVLGGDTNPSSEELGIVSSSIAHELNNPLAGILAALNVLELDDYSDEIHEKFDQMKQSVGRCKKLVETFLGFSKVDSKNRSLTSYGKESFSQAMELMRARLIENNITITFDYIEKEKLSYPVNSHVLSMIFYLFLGELLTSISHLSLVELTKSNKIELKVSEDYFGIELHFTEKITLSSNFINSRLIEHLVDGEGLKLINSPGSVKLFYKDEDGKL